MTTSLTPTPTRLVVRCEDGRIRHLHDSTVEGRSFTNDAAGRLMAQDWANYGHACTVNHTYEVVECNGTEGCIVLAGIDGPTLWDCNCTSCCDIVADYYNTEGPTCSICDGLGHGYPGGPPCPLEVCDYSGEPEWAL